MTRSRQLAESDSGSGEGVEEENEGEGALWLRWRQSGDLSVRQRLLKLHLPYARIVAATYYGKRLGDEVEFAEYHQLACLGMIESIDRFDPAVGVQFRTFAARRMHGSILDGLERATEKHQQIAARHRIEAQRRASIASTQAGDDDVHLEEGIQAAAPLRRTAEQALQYVAEAGIAFALAWILDGTGMLQRDEQAENFPFYRSAELKELRTRIASLVKALPPTESAVIQGHYFQQRPFEEVAKQLNLSRGRVSQLHRRALLRLRQALHPPNPFELLT